MTERTPLRSDTAQQYDPQYVFNTGGRVYRNKVRQCQCCVCATVLACFVVAIVATVGYSVSRDTEDAGGNGTNATTVLTSLLLVQFPLPEATSAPWDATAAQLEEALNIGRAGLRDRDRQEQGGPRLDTDSPSYRHQMAVRTAPEATRLARAGYVMDVATRHLAASGVTAVGRGPAVPADWMPPEDCADQATSCPVTPYRSADGSCNNPHHPHQWGVAMRPFRRTLPPSYADGVSTPRVASDGGALPSARQVSVTVHRPMYRDDPHFTVMLAVWGQFIDHDVTATALNTGGDGGAIACCGATPLHPECFPVSLAAGDPYFHQYNLSCMEFVRSAPAPSCALGPREQLNQASAYLDGSVVYGTTQNVTAQLRSMAGGTLRMSVTADGRPLLPYSADPSDGCNQAQENARGRYCFASGDARANENLHLTTMHLLWARQHNLVAGRLAQVNPHWGDERLFQEARRIVVAQIQHITYREFLPVLLGRDLMAGLGLDPTPVGHYHGYNFSVDASVANSFAAAAFRFAHTLLPGLMKMLRNGSEEYVELHRMLFNPYSLYNPGHLDATLRGALDTQVERVDPYFTTEVTEHLFERRGSGPCGLDLVSLNIQRGRDHGLPAYPAWRERCGLSRPQQFQDLEGVVDDESLRRMQRLYRSVDDVDLYTGALAEHPLQGGIVGPTITCLLADQFLRLKRGDRFWYETAEAPQAFTPGQLSALRTSSLARIICDNADAVQTAQPQVMRTVGPDNWRVACSAIPGPSLHLWREEAHQDMTLPGTRVRSLSTRLGARVTSGSVVSADGTSLWGGTQPTALPANTSLRPTWSGALSAGVLQGHFSLGHGPGRWLNGQFSLQLAVDWQQGAALWPPAGGTFTSPVYFREVQGREEVVAAPPQPDVTALLSGAPNITAPWLPTAPVVLLGHYSQDRSVFWWTGDVMLTLPAQEALDKQEALVGMTTEKREALVGMTTEKREALVGMTTEKREALVSMTTTDKQEALAAMTTDKQEALVGMTTDEALLSGSVLSIAMTTDEGQSFALNMSRPLVFTPGKAVAVQWNGSVSSQLPGSVTLQGVMSHGAGHVHFSVTVHTSAAFNCSLSGRFTSPIHVRELQELRPLKDAAAEVLPVQWDVTTSSDTPTTAGRELPVTLLGTYADDQLQFLWAGDVSLVLPSDDTSHSSEEHF